MKHPSQRALQAIVVASLIGWSSANGAQLPPRAEPHTESDLELAFHHAPIHYQDTDSSHYRGDYLTRVDYDRNWTTTDNWEHLSNFPQQAFVYFSVVENATHWFIVYAFYHPQDWSDTPFDNEHENDLEGMLSIIRKDGTRHGKFEGMITVYHNDFFSFSPRNGRLRHGHENIDGWVTMEFFEGAEHVRTSQQAKGHGLKAWPHTGDFRGRSNEDGIIYYPSKTTAGVPRNGNDRRVYYKLIDIFEPNGLWARQLREARRSRDHSETFATWGKFKGGSGGSCGDGTKMCSEDAAKLPWLWDDHNDGPAYAGEMALDPVHLVDHYFNNLGAFPQKYIRNRYIRDLKQEGFTPAAPPRGWPSQLNMHRLFANE